MSDPTQPPPPPREEPKWSVPPPPPPTSGGYQPAPPPPVGATSRAGQPADLGVRFIARLLDFIVVGIANSIVTGLIVVGVMSTSGGFGYGTGGSYAARAVSSVISAVIAVGYFVVMESRKGQTLGKMLLKLRTRGPGGGIPTTEEAFKRNAWVGIGILGVLPFLGLLSGPLELAAIIVIMVTISNSPTRQGWHDNLADGTQVVRLS